MPTQPAALWVERRRNWLWVMAVVIVLSGVLVATALGFMREQTLQAGMKLNESLVQVVAEQTTRTLQTVDERLLLTLVSMQLMPNREGINQRWMERMFQDQLKDMPEIKALWFQTTSGHTLYSSLSEDQSTTDAKLTAPAADYAKIFAQHPTLLFHVGEPTRSNADDEWLIHVAKPVVASPGVLPGVLIAAFKPQSINQTWDRVDYGKHGSIALLNQHGILLMRSPFVDETMGKSFKHRPVFQQLLPVNPFGTYQDVSGVDGIERMFSYRVLEAYPELVLILGRSMEQVLKPWTEWAKLVVSLWLVASVSVLALNGYVINVRRERTQISKDLMETEGRYHALFVGSVDAILLTATDGRILSVNPATCRMFDRTETDILAIGRSGLVDTSDPALPVAMEERARTGRFQGELAFFRKSGERFIGEVFASVFKSEDGQQLSTMIIRDVTERKNAESQLRANADKLQILSRSVILAQETERRRIAAELHDELGQSLTAIKISLLTGHESRQEHPANSNAESIRIVDETLQQVRRLALALRPSILDNLGLVPALNAMGKQMAARAGFAFIFFPVVLEKRLVSELETTCFRIVQECLTNIVRHADAKNVSITMLFDEQNLMVSVQDDGVGFDWVRAQSQASVGESFGSVGMQERAQLAGGELMVDTEPGAGCTVSFICPLQLVENKP